MLVAEILEEAADACHADMSDILAGRRFPRCVRAKRATIYSMRHYSEAPPSFNQLGRLLGTDHSTAIHNYDVARRQREEDPSFQQLTEILIEHAQTQVAQKRVGRARSLDTVLGQRAKPIVRRNTKIGEREKQAVYDVLHRSAELFGADLTDILRHKHWADNNYRTAAAAIWAARHGSDPRLTFPQLSYLFGRHPTAVIHAEKRARGMRAESAEFAHATDTLLTEAKRRLS